MVEVKRRLSAMAFLRPVKSWLNQVLMIVIQHLASAVARLLAMGLTT